MYLDYLVQNKSITTLTQRYAHMLILCGFWKYGSGLFEHDLYEIIGVVLQCPVTWLAFHTQQRLGPFRWLEFMCRCEFFGEPLLPCFSSTFNYYKYLMTSYTIVHEKVRLMPAKGTRKIPTHVMVG